MSSKEKVKDRPRMMSVKPSQIKIPDVRVTSSWDPELLGMFRDSIKAMGIVEPIVAVEEKGELWLVDGLHRLQEAQLQNLPRVQVVAIPGSLRDVYLKNLMLNRLRGKTKTSEMVMVIKKLEQEFKMDMDTIARATGLKRDYVEKMLVIGRVRPEVLADLDAERIHVGHAYEIGRVEDPDVQLRLLLQVKQYDLTVSDLRDVVDSTLKILNERKASPDSATVPMPIPPATIKCHFCDLERPVREVRGFNLCQTCFAIGYEAVRAAKAAQESTVQENQEEKQ
jgi:ParB-like chromosome segregation protein Spo0J